MRWLLVFCVFMAGLANAATLQVTVDASGPTWDNGSVTASTAGWYVRLYKGAQGSAKSLYDAKPWAATVRFVSTSSSTTTVWCYDATFAVDTDGDGKPDIEGVHSAEWCGTHADQPIVLRPGVPKGVTGQAPAP
jgi:hypothetical protein